MSPYRTPPADVPAVEADEREPCPDVDLVPMFAVLWVASAARVVSGIVHHACFDGDAALAAIALFALPWLVRETIAWLIRDVVRRLLRSGRMANTFEGPLRHPHVGPTRSRSMSRA